MKHTVRVLLLLAVTTLGLSALSGSASATTSAPRESRSSVSCSGRLVSIVLNGPEANSTAPTGSTVEVLGRIISAPGADLGLGSDESISNVIDDALVSLNGGARVDAAGEGGSIRASLSPIQSGENTITVEVDIDATDDQEELTCKFKVTGVSETSTTTLVPVDDAATTPTADVSTTTVPTATTVPAAGTVPTAPASVQGASATAPAATPAASPQSELAFTGKSSLPLGLLGLALALLGAGLLTIERKQRLKQAV